MNTRISALNFLLCASLSIVSLKAIEFRTIFSFREIESLFSHAHENTLIVFDIDETLMYWDCNMEKNFSRNPVQKLWKEFKEKASDRFEHLASIKFLHCKKGLTEPYMVDVIKQLQGRGVKTLALTRMGVDSFGIIPSMQEWRYRELYDLGIRFEDWCNGSLVFEEFLEKNGKAPVLHKGILVTNWHEKGKVLGAFMDAVNYHPLRVILFDDHLSNLETVHSECEKRGIEFEGYLYLAKDVAFEEFNAAIAAYQLQHLFEHEQWLDDHEVVSHLSSTSR